MNFEASWIKLIGMMADLFGPVPCDKSPASWINKRIQEVITERDLLRRSLITCALERDELRKVRDAARADRGFMAMERDELRAQLNEHNKHPRELIKTIDELRAELETRTAERDLFRTGDQFIAAERDELRTSCNLLQTDLKSYINVCEDLAKTVADLRTERHASVVTIRELGDKCTNLANVVNDRRAQIRELRAELEALRKPPAQSLHDKALALAQIIRYGHTVEQLAAKIEALFKD